MNSIISSLIVTLVFAVIGWLIFRGTAAPKKWWAWLLILLVTIVAGFIGVNSRVLSFLGLAISLNDCLQGLAFGAIAAFVIKKK